MAKHQGDCYRIINKRKYINYCDLIESDDQNQKHIDDAKQKYKYVRKIKHPSGYYQLFVSEGAPNDLKPGNKTLK